MKKLITRIAFSTLMAVAMTTNTANADIVFDFNNNTELDNAGAGTTMSATDGVDTVVLTLEGAFAPGFVENLDGTFSLTGSTVAADTSIGSSNSIGVNNPDINNSDFETFVGNTAGTEGTDINPGESVVLSFDTDVVFTEFNFSSLDVDGAEFEVTVEGSPTVFTFGDAGSADDYADPLGSLVIAAGTDVTFAAVSTTFGPDDPNDFSVRITEISLNVVSTVPEPSSIALLGLLGLGVVARRRR